MSISQKIATGYRSVWKAVLEMKTQKGVQQGNGGETLLQKWGERMSWILKVKKGVTEEELEDKPRLKAQVQAEIIPRPHCFWNIWQWAVPLGKGGSKHTRSHNLRSLWKGRAEGLQVQGWKTAQRVLCKEMTWSDLHLRNETWALIWRTDWQERRGSSQTGLLAAIKVRQGQLWSKAVRLRWRGNWFES